MIYRLTRDVIVMSTGFIRSAGRQIGENEIRNRDLWDLWVAEGVVTVDRRRELAPAPKPEVEEAPLPQVGASLEKEFEGDTQVRDMSFEELKAMGERLKIKGWWSMKQSTLIKKIEEQS